MYVFMKINASRDEVSHFLLSGTRARGELGEEMLRGHSLFDTQYG